MMRCAARAIVCSPDEQKRFTVIPGTVTGQPARIAIWRAMFQPVAPSGLAHPMITSSTSSGSTLARLSAAWTTCPPIFAPCVMLSAPRQLLQSGVRAVETITASTIESPSFLGKFDEQGRRLPLRALVALLKSPDRRSHVVQPDGLGVEHRPAAIRRKAIAGEIDHVDVGGAQRDPFFQDIRAFVHQRVDAALDDFLIRDRARLDAELGAVIGDELVDLRVDHRNAAARAVAVEALAGLLPEAALLSDEVGDLGVDEIRALLVTALPDLPADVLARHVVHREIGRASCRERV